MTLPEHPGDLAATPHHAGTGLRAWGRRLGGLFLLLALSDLVFRRAWLTYGAAACVLAMFGLIVVESLRTGVARTRWFDVRRQDQPLGFALFVVAMALGAVAMCAALVTIGAARRAAP